jgi:hypothetical protein
MLISTLLSLLYMPAVQLSLQVLFCHRNIMCQYDCYADAVHVRLVIVAGIMLFVVGLCVPIFYFFIVNRVVSEYHEFLSSFDSTLHEQHWDKFVATVPSPFANFYKPYRHAYAYFECMMLFMKACMTGVLIALPSESMQQLVTTAVLQSVFSLFIARAVPFAQPLGNRILIGAQMFLLIFLTLMCASLLDPTNDAIGVLMIVLAVAFILVCGAFVALTRNENDDTAESSDESGDGFAD